jgi:pilus assembly protein Flp/PilA
MLTGCLVYSQIEANRSLINIEVANWFDKTGARGFQMLHGSERQGQGLVEYALILMLVALVVIIILMLLGPAIGNTFSNVVANI